MMRMTTAGMIDSAQEKSRRPNNCGVVYDYVAPPLSREVSKEFVFDDVVLVYSVWRHQPDINATRQMAIMAEVFDVKNLA